MAERELLKGNDEMIVEKIKEEQVTFNVDGEKLTNNKFIIDILPKANLPLRFDTIIETL